MRPSKLDRPGLSRPWLNADGETGGGESLVAGRTAGMRISLKSRTLGRTVLLIGGSVVLLAFLAAGASTQPAGGSELEAQVHEACSKCHQFPDPSIIARNEWPEKINTMFHLANLELAAKYGRPIWELDPTEVARYFTARAPAILPTPPWATGQETNPLPFEHRSIMGGQTIIDQTGGANVQLWDLFDDVPGPELVICDMLSGWVTWTDPDDPKGGLQPIARLNNPCHSELVDLDRDGKLDLLVAELGDPLPSDTRLGSVALLHGLGNKQFEVVRLTGKLGRVADARAADFDGDGDLDVVVGEFGWRKLGSIIYLENVSSKPGALRFESREIDPRHGTIHVPIVDLNRDGKLDFVALISQEHERVVAFLGNGDGTFTPEDLYIAPHPHWGSSGIEVLDLDGDGDMDVLYTNGDTLDDMKLKTYHGIQWLENQGAYPFLRHVIAPYYGVHRAEAGDIDGDGDLDLAACAFLPQLPEETRQKLHLSGIAWYEQTADHQWRLHPIANLPCDFPTLDLGDFNGDGRLDIMTAALMARPRPDGSEAPLVEIWKQLPKR
ncbi:MAG: VCBS repeat-containing protein [Acidobacteriota bacterium]